MPLFNVDVKTDVAYTLLVDAKDAAEAKRKARQAEYVEAHEAYRGAIRVQACEPELPYEGAGYPVER